MKIGFFAVGIGPTAEPELVALTARTAEESGFHSLWAPEHVVLFEQYESKYPYSQDGRMPVSSTTKFLDPFLALTYAAAHTRTIRLGTGVCLLPERNPVVTAKEVASLDVLSGGRFDFGVGIGWLEEEFAGVGVPWERRADRTREYLAAMKTLWADEESGYRGEFVTLPKARMHPKPVQKPHPPIVFGGESGPALRRVGEIGDGWLGFNVTAADAPARIEKIRGYARAAGRDPGALCFWVSPGIGVDVSRDDLARYRDAGVEQVVVGRIARDAAALVDQIRRLGDELVHPAANL